MNHAEKPSHAYKIQAGDGFIIMERYREFKSFAAHLPIPTRGDRSPTDKMRITVSCPNIKTYLDSPGQFLPEKVTCLNNPEHRPHHHPGWERFFVVDHVEKVLIPMFRWYCRECKESISIWPEFVLPYQPEGVETHELAVVEHLAGKSFVETARELGYDPRTVAQWVARIIGQALSLAPKVIGRMLQDMPNSSLPLSPTVAVEAVKVLLAWLREWAEFVNLTRTNRLIGLCNLLGQGHWPIWGAPPGRPRLSG